MEGYQTKNNVLIGYPEEEFAIRIPEGVHSVESYLFDDACISALSLPDSVEHLGLQTFCWCDRLRVLNWSNRIERLERDVFSAIAVSELCLPPKLVYIGNCAFQRCSSLLKLYLSRDVQLISDRAFQDCYSLRYVSFQEQLKYIGEEAFSNAGLEVLFLPNSLLSIGRRAFSGCTNLRYLSLNEGLATIGQEAFRGCISLESVRIPETVMSIAEGAFADCDHLKTVELPQDLHNANLENSFPDHTHIIFYEKDTKQEEIGMWKACSREEKTAWFRKATKEALRGNASAYFALGCYYLSAKNDRQKAKEYLQKAAEQGHAEAHYQLSLLDCFENRRLHLIRAASLGCKKAMLKLMNDMD